MKMNKKTFLLVLFLITFGYFTNRITSLFISKDFLLVSQWLWCFIGVLVFRNESKNPLNTIRNKKYVLWFFLIMIISTVSPYVEYNQSILNTIISQRANYSIAVLLIFLYIHPSIDDIYITLKRLALLSVVLFVYSIFEPSFFLDAEQLERRALSGSKDIGVSNFLPGFMLLAVCFYFLAHRLIKGGKKTTINLVMFITFMIVIFFVQNRQTLLITLPIFLYTFYKMKNTYSRIIFILLVFIGLFVFGSYALTIYEGLVEESSNQLNNEDYNRWQALEVFFVDWKFNFFNILFGHGVGSIDSEYTNKLTSVADSKGAYLQDIGFLGSMFFYGILFVILNYYFIIQGFMKKNMPYYIKFWCFGLILIPVFQNWGMMNNDSSVLFGLLFYLIIYYNTYNKLNVNNENINYYR